MPLSRPSNVKKKTNFFFCLYNMFVYCVYTTYDVQFSPVSLPQLHGIFDSIV